MLASLSEKVEYLEKSSVGKIGKNIPSLLNVFTLSRLVISILFLLHFTGQLDDRQMKLQKDVNDARHGVDFVMVSGSLCSGVETASHAGHCPI